MVIICSIKCGNTTIQLTQIMAITTISIKLHRNEPNKQIEDMHSVVTDFTLIDWSSKNSNILMIA